MSCIFCKIINRELPSYTIFEDELFVAFLDISPASDGHVLIVPKRHIQDIYGLTEEESAALMPLAQKIAGKINSTLSPDGLNILQNNGKAAGQDVFHYHLHVIPRYSGDAASARHPFFPRTSASQEELGKLAEKLMISC